MTTSATPTGNEVLRGVRTDTEQLARRSASSRGRRLEISERLDNGLRRPLVNKPLDAGETYRLGRESDGRENFVFLNDRKISKLHAEIRCDQHGLQCLLRDLGSKNGTFLNGDRLQKGKERRLRSHDRIEIGPYEIIFEHTKATPTAPVAVTLSSRFIGRDLREPIELTACAKKLLITDHPLLIETFNLISSVADSNSTVLILGETGTGKELAALALHEWSKRHVTKMFAINIAAEKKETIGSALFGHRRGSFTGAVADRKGAFLSAHESTLFLDEIGDLDIEIQISLLRVLEQRKVMQIGSDEEKEIDVRVIAATNCNLQEKIQKKEFREDLFYRLNVVPIHMPPLRACRESIPLFANYFIEVQSDKYNRIGPTVSEDLYDRLMSYSWPGNLRQLNNFTELCVLRLDGTEIKPAHFDDWLQSSGGSRISNPIFPSMEAISEPRLQAEAHEAEAFRLRKQERIRLLSSGESRTKISRDLGYRNREAFYKDLRETYDINIDDYPKRRR